MASSKALSPVNWLISDFDGTLTLEPSGFLSAFFYEILDLVQNHKKKLIINTGRSSGWGLFLLTHFPVETVITEGGATIISKLKPQDIYLPLWEKREEFYFRFLLNPSEQLQLQQIKAEIVSTVATSYPLSADSDYRHCDFALNKSYLNSELQNKLKMWEKKYELKTTQSNIHYNITSQNCSKFIGLQILFQEIFNVDIHKSLEECVYWGDSLNDQEIFKELPQSIGVGNIDKVLSFLKFPPSVILPNHSNFWGVLGVLESLRRLSNNQWIFSPNIFSNLSSEKSGNEF
jgi:HAD superfamily hydrolase (TIGR01484 family)